MSDFNLENAKVKQNSTLEKVQDVCKTLQTEVVDYYWHRVPENEDEAIENERVIRRYLKQAYEDLDRILDVEDRDLGY